MHSGLKFAQQRLQPGMQLWQCVDEIERLRRAWDELSAAAQPGHPFLSWAWQQGWLRSHRELRPLVLTDGRADGRLTALLPLRLRAARWPGSLPHLEWLAEGSGGDELDLLLAPGADANTGRRMLDFLLSLKGWSVADLHSVREDSQLLRCLDEKTRARSSLRLEFELPWLELPASFEALLAAASANFRSEIRRRRRAWSQHAGGLEIECVEAPRRLQERLPELFRLHNLRQRQKAQPGIFEAEAVREFHACLIEELAPSSHARLYLLHAFGRPRAALYGIQTGERFAFFQSGFDPEYTALSPGTVLMSGVIEDCIRRGERRFDFLRGDERYKHRWTAQARRSHRLRLARTLAGSLAVWRPGGIRHTSSESEAVMAPAQAPGKHSLRYRARAACWFIRRTENWPRVLGHKFFGWRLGECRFRDGLRIELLAPEAELWQLGEIFRERVYDRDFGEFSGEGWIVDLGANIGCFSLHAARKLAPAGHVLAVEPNPACLAVLRRNLERNRAANVCVRAAAVAAQAGVGRLRVSPRSTDSQLATAVALAGRMDATLEVETCTLEQVLEGLPHVALLKMDIEGQEFAVLRQTPPEAWQAVDRVALEYHRAADPGGSPQELILRLRQLGYCIRRHYAPEPHVGYLLAERRRGKEAA